MMRRFGRSYRRRLFFWGLVLLAFLVVMKGVSVAAQHRPISPKPAAPIQGRGDSYQMGKENTQTLKSDDAPTLLERGKSNYDAGRFADALVALQQAAQYYERAGDSEALLRLRSISESSSVSADRKNQALSLNYLSLAYQNLGQWERAEAAIIQSLTLLQNQSNPAILAQTLNNRGSLQLATGQTEAALKTWQDAEKAYAQAGDEMGVLGSKINQAQAWQSLGMFKRSQRLLQQVQQALTTQPNSPMKAIGLRSLGLVLYAVGDLQTSQTILNESLAVAQTLNSPSDIGAALLSLGNTVRGLGMMQEALQYYQQAAQTATNPLSQLKAQLNQLKLLIHLEQFTNALALLPSIQTNLSNLALSRDAIYARVNLAESLMQLVGAQGLRPQPNNNTQIPNHQEIAQLLAHAAQQAKTLNDPRAESLALGSLGKLYEQTQQWSEAQRLTQQALILSQGINAADISYQWQWQLARVLTREGEIKSAIAANQQAVDLLQALRGDLVAMNPEVRFSFQEEIEPIYRHLVSLLLQPPHPPDFVPLRYRMSSGLTKGGMGG